MNRATTKSSPVVDSSSLLFKAKMFSSSRSLGSNSDISACSLNVTIKNLSKIHQLTDKKPTTQWASHHPYSKPIDDTTSSDDSSLEGEKRVRFSHAIAKRRIPSCKSMSPEQKSKFWYNTNDRDKMRRTARCSAVKTVTFLPRYVTEINKALKAARSLAATRNADETERLLNDECAVERHSKYLRAWSCQEDGDTFRGLEDWVSQQHHFERGELANDSRTMVVDMSKLLKGRSRREDAVSKHYQEMSRTSVILARLLADADALAAAEVYKEENMLHVPEKRQPVTNEATSYAETSYKEPTYTKSTRSEPTHTKPTRSEPTYFL